MRTRWWLTMFLMAAVAGCGGSDDEVPGNTRPELAGINADPKWLATTHSLVLGPDGTLSNQSQYGNVVPGDLIQLGIARIRFVYNGGLDCDQSGNCLTGDDIRRTYDSAVTTYARSNIPILLVLNFQTVPLSDGQSPTDLWNANDSDHGWDNYVAAFSDAAAEIIGRTSADYEHAVEAWEIMNEWNGSEASPEIPGAAYGQLLATTHEKMLSALAAKHAGDDSYIPSVNLITGGLFSSKLDQIDDIVARLQSIPDLATNAVGIGIHPYNAWPGDDGWLPPTGDSTADWPLMRDVIAPLQQFGLPIWVTEWGINDHNLGDATSVKSDYINGFFRIVANDADHWVDHAFYFAWSDDNEDGFGLTYRGPDGAPIDKDYTSVYRGWVQGKLPARARSRVTATSDTRRGRSSPAPSAAN